MSAFRQGFSRRLRTSLFAMLALALVNQSVFGLGCLSCTDEAALHGTAAAEQIQADSTPAPPDDGCGTCCDALPPGQCGGQVATISASLVQWQSNAPLSYAAGALSTPDPPAVFTERFRPPIR